MGSRFGQPIKRMVQYLFVLAPTIWKSRARKYTVLGTLGAILTVSLAVNEVTDGAFFDRIFPWRGGNDPPVIEKVFAREAGEEIPPVVRRGGGLFLNVIAVDPEGDDILYEWVPPKEGGFFRVDPPSDQSSRLVFFDPPAEAGEYIVRVRVRDELHEAFTEGQITVKVVEPQ